MVFQATKKSKNGFQHNNLYIRLVGDYIQETTPSIILLLQGPSQYSTLKNFNIPEHFIFWGQRCGNVAHTCIQNTTIQQYTADQCR
jgi:hypothetical protein